MCVCVVLVFARGSFDACLLLAWCLARATFAFVVFAWCLFCAYVFAWLVLVWCVAGVCFVLV